MKTFIILFTLLLFSFYTIEAQTKKKPPKTKAEQPAPTRYPQPDVSNNKKTFIAEMISVKGGTFTMGSTEGGPDEHPTHQVTVSDFMIGKYEVTQELWESVMGNNPSDFKGSKKPVEYVGWYDVVEFCNQFSEKQGLQKVYSGSGDKIVCDFNLNGYRLPTEAEWEYAAKGGNKSKGYRYSGSNNIDAIAWYDGDLGSTTNDVGRKNPNELGIYDMSGNVWEWCWDRYGTYNSGNQTNPKGASSGSDRVFRGGSWYGSAGNCRVTYRSKGRTILLGFRVVRTK